METFLNFSVGKENVVLRFKKVEDGSIQVTIEDSRKPYVCEFKTDGTLLLYADVDKVFQSSGKEHYIKVVEEMNDGD